MADKGGGGLIGVDFMADKEESDPICIRFEGIAVEEGRTRRVDVEGSGPSCKRFETNVETEGVDSF